MRHLRMLGLMLLAALALGSYAAAMASAEAGLLTLSGKSEAIEVHAEEGKEAKLTAGKNPPIICTTLDLTIAKAEGAHVSLFNEVTLDFLGCKQGELNCRSEDLKAAKDPLGTILVLADFHFVELLNGSTLEAGLAVILLDPNTKAVGVVKIKCGAGNIEVKGTAKGVVTGASKTADITKGSFVFGGKNVCDTSDTLCKTLEAEPFLANFSGAYEEATETVTTPATISPMVLLDY